jgi:hypothetical protein
VQTDWSHELNKEFSWFVIVATAQRAIEIEEGGVADQLSCSGLARVIQQTGFPWDRQTRSVGVAWAGRG